MIKRRWILGTLLLAACGGGETQTPSSRLPTSPSRAVWNSTNLATALLDQLPGMLIDDRDPLSDEDFVIEGCDKKNVFAAEVGHAGVVFRETLEGGSNHVVSEYLHAFPDAASATQAMTAFKAAVKCAAEGQEDQEIQELQSSLDYGEDAWYGYSFHRYGEGGTLNQGEALRYGNLVAIVGQTDRSDAFDGGFANDVTLKVAGLLRNGPPK